MVEIAAAELRKLAAMALRASGVGAANAAIVAEALVAAELDGLGSHGLMRLPLYAEQVRAKWQGKLGFLKK